MQHTRKGKNKGKNKNATKEKTTAKAKTLTTPAVSYGVTP
jgi:hypothetical protein